MRLLTHEEAKAAKKTLLRFESPYWIITPDFGHVSNAMYVEADGQIINRDFNYSNPFVSAGRDDVAIRPVIKVSEIKT